MGAQTCGGPLGWTKYSAEGQPAGIRSPSIGPEGPALRPSAPGATSGGVDHDPGDQRTGDHEAQPREATGPPALIGVVRPVTALGARRGRCRRRYRGWARRPVRDVGLRLARPSPWRWPGSVDDRAGAGRGWLDPRLEWVVRRGNDARPPPPFGREGLGRDHGDPVQLRQLAPGGKYDGRGGWRRGRGGGPALPRPRRPWRGRSTCPKGWR